ncbi:MAG: Nitronate monooxygenase [Alphaproteobacteria bacterium ADurb.Bin438]|nr:MAG: Nitronate monooxygenase [Alphaproteobacteria bacterium ADurb.Bin438]
MIKAGTDALIIEGHEAGGHIGPVSTTILAQEILPALSQQVPVFVAGGIGTGKMMASYLMLGASGVQVGTRFVCTHECNAHAKFKEIFIKSSARDAMPTVQVDPRFPVIPVRAITNEGSRKFMEIQTEIVNKYKNGEIELKEGQLQIESFWMGSLRRAVVEGDIETGSLMAGQSVEFVKKEMSVKEVIDELTDDAIAELKFYDGLLAK